MNEIADDVLGKQVGTTYCEGLVDAESEEVFYQKLKEKKCFGKRKERSTLIALLGSMISFASISVSPSSLEC